MLALLLSLTLSAEAKTFADVTMSDTATVGGQTVTLNGMGLREKYFVDVYVGGLYLQHPTKDANTAINADEPKRIVMHFVYNVTKEQVVESFNESFGAQPAAAAQKANTDKIIEWVPATISKGQELTFEYVPGSGTSFVVNGTKMGTIAGADFMKVIWGIYLGPKPPTAALKSGMLGG